MLSLNARILLLGLVVCVAVGNSVIFFADSAESRATLSELVTITAACGAVLLAAAIALRQNIHAPHGKTYLSLAIGLVLWLCADIIWAAYELYYHVAAPIPSISDILWLSGYLFFAYNLFLTYKEFQVRINKKILLATIIGNAVFLGYLIPFTISLSDLSSPAGIAMFLVIIAYPISNAILTIPAIPILFGLWRDKPWSIPWTFKALSLFCIVVTDSWFAFIVISGLYEQVWLSAMFFGAEYLIMASGLLWFNLFLAMYKTHEGGAAAAFAKTSSNSRTSQDYLKVTNGSSNRKKNTPTRVQYLQVVVAAILIGGILSYGFMTSIATKSTIYVGPAEEGAGGGNTILMGALLPLTGTLSSFGESGEASLQLAVEDVNNQFARSGLPTRVSLIIEDT